MSPAAAVARFLDHLAVERRYSPRTVLRYRQALDKLLAHLAREGLADWAALQPLHLRQFIAREHRGGAAPASLHALLAAARSLFRYLVREGDLNHDPAAGVRAPRLQRKLPQVLDVDEAAALVEIPVDGAAARRDRAILELLYSSGLRVAELVALRWGDLDLADGSVRVTGKGGKARDVPVGSRAREALAALRGEDAPDGDTPVFRGRLGGPISAAAVRRRLKMWARAQGVDKRVYPHLLRHSCASHVLESSGDLRAVQELLGHADIGTTQIYTHLDFQHLARVYDAAHPRARRRSGG
ncbi:MAG TPA: tyrosine recombinase XerC [Rhodanobacteraceae bacterium]|nr:tyrosine recombinase XerC [Rhodanobacteraceae bacterium]